MIEFTRKRMTREIRRLRQAFLPRLFDLRLDLRRTNRIYDPLIAAAQGEQKERLINEYLSERDLTQEQIDRTLTERLLRTAHRFDIPVPNPPYHRDDFEDENWERAHMTGAWLLKTACKQSLIKQIRDERKYRFEDRTRWLPLVVGIGGMLIGLASTLTSLISALKK